MKYRYCPLFKYIFLLCALFMFNFHAKLFVDKENLYYALAVVVMVMMIDYMFISNHENILCNEKAKADVVVDEIKAEDEEESISSDELEELLE